MLDETETLDDVFAFLSDFDLPMVEDAAVEHLELSDGQLSVESNSSSPAAEDRTRESIPTSSQDAKRPKRSKRTSQKQRLESLRETIRELNAELLSLLPPWQPDFVPASHGQLVPRRKSMWEAIAARQLERRQKAEEENAKLREMAQMQVQEARNLRRVLKRRTKIDMMEDMLGMKKQKALEAGIPEDNPQVFEDMLQDVDELYVGVDSLFAAKGLYRLPCPGRHSESRRNVTNGFFLEFMQRHMLPFDLQTTEKAVWKAMHQITFQGLTGVQSHSQRVQFGTHHVEEDNNTLRTSFFVETSNLGDVRGALLRKVVRKYVEKDRVVFICKNLMEPLLHDRGRSSGFHSRTTLRMVVREDPSAGPRARVSILDSHFSATRHDQGLPDSCAIRTPANLDVGIAAWGESITRITQQVENLAVDDCCEKRRVRLA